MPPGRKLLSIKTTTTLAAIISFALFFTPINGKKPQQEESVQQIIETAQAMFAARTSYMLMEVTIKSPRFTRVMELQAWTKGSAKGLIKLNKPEKNRGITILKNGSEVWQYIPKIDKTVLIPPSMLLQSWMGSDLTYDDIVQESSMLNDYSKEITRQNSEAWHITLTPHQEAPVVWGKITVTIQKKTWLPSQTLYYDEAGDLIREIVYDQLRSIDGRLVPTLWKITPKTPERKGYSTTVRIKEIKFNLPMKNSFFTKQNLKKKSKSR